MKSILDTAKKILPKTPQSFDDLRETIHDAAQLFYKIAGIRKRQDSDLAAVNKTYGAELAALEKQYKAHEKTILQFAKSHRDQFGEKQTAKVDGHAVIFRQSPGKVTNPLKDEDAAELILASDDDDLIRSTLLVKVLPDKTTIKNILEAGGPMAKKLQDFGFKVERPETVKFEPAEQDS